MNMKKISYLLGLCAMVCCLAAGFASCSDDDEDVSTSELVGLWEPIHTEGYDIWDGEKDEWDEDINAATNNSDYNMRIEFTSDGTYKQYYYYNGWKLDFDNGTYRTNGNKIHVYDPEEDEEITLTVVSLSGDRMVLEEKEVWEDEEYYEKLTFKRVLN